MKYIVFALLAIIIGVSLFFTIRNKKKRGLKCAGCPYKGTVNCHRYKS